LRESTEGTRVIGLIGDPEPTGLAEKAPEVFLELLDLAFFLLELVF
jgi:hypothetical protein